ncbi:hypothetical protein N474_02840 [Pseudoalteromonas luteoviolacea CPMOR-2]|uniref:Cytoskeleton protein RodZ-like C-terminal domain-containing protein n=1 Tax=Pseudoalteromonas luteoviolacea DSM 6061 TaxID=1365250 RepID=A0A161ZVJ9_9GAMM|nr:RodZ domain-containing protein [Pseudoalteromonas luteoviolacea]KZN35119.1 hypothetical protein N475_03205 [Pseudoalteromonas luteoviolacea DSM 6061]KZN52869.1 hypothetical protein N474_02840 [Pseudoalteromonas luteoviolacea CPMOR-2]MBE0384862.1 cytoskeleton protein RodZ [Pseudoalteromonas luteoviolacea DSM 6061]
MNQEEIETTAETISLGQTLANARAEQNLSLEDVAGRLKLNHTQLTKLEQDDYHSLGPETFVRGYIKSYSALLGLDNEQVLSLYQSPNVPEQKRNMKSFSRRTEKEAHDSRLMIVSYIVAIVFLGLSAFWWWQTASTSDNVEEASFIPESTSSSAPQSPSLTEQSIDNAQSVETEASTETVSPEQSLDTNMPVEPSAVQEQQNKVAATNELASAPVEQPQLETVEAPSNTSTSTSNDSELTPPSQVVMHFEEDSWVEIFDATQERVAFGVKKAGYTMTVSGIAPFSVVLGKHQVVSIQLDGQPVDISGLPRNRLAKFNLPLAE